MAGSIHTEAEDITDVFEDSASAELVTVAKPSVAVIDRGV